MKTKTGLWKLTPSVLYGYQECPSCFWAEQHFGRHPFSIPPVLNMAMDEKLKNRYDWYRERGELPPEVADQVSGVNLYEDAEQLEQWREQYDALTFFNDEDGYMLSGKLDEVFVDIQTGELLPADYKSSGNPPKANKYKYYELQLHAYALMLEEKGQKVGETGYLLHYYTQDRSDDSLAMYFTTKVDVVSLDIQSFRQKLRDIVAFLEKEYPGPNADCDKCAWIEKRKQDI